MFLELFVRLCREQMEVKSQLTRILTGDALSYVWSLALSTGLFKISILASAPCGNYGDGDAAGEMSGLL